MKFDFVNLVAIVSAIITVVIAFLMTRDVISERKKVKKISVPKEGGNEENRYKKILKATYWLEHERERNCGEHHSDENVYLNRAEVMREKTPFFSYVNEVWQTQEN